MNFAYAYDIDLVYTAIHIVKPTSVLIMKAFKNNAHDASKERLRLQAVEAYRQRKGWTSRLGIQISPPAIETPLV